MSRDRHSKKEVEAALAYAESMGCVSRKPPVMLGAASIVLSIIANAAAVSFV